MKQQLAQLLNIRIKFRTQLKGQEYIKAAFIGEPINGSDQLHIQLGSLSTENKEVVTYERFELLLFVTFTVILTLIRFLWNFIQQNKINKRNKHIVEAFRLNITRSTLCSRSSNDSFGCDTSVEKDLAVTRYLTNTSISQTLRFSAGLPQQDCIFHQNISRSPQADPISLLLWDSTKYGKPSSLLPG
ncbi:hypothetical protein KAFR_0C00470 [Kazachstania africana CBS 2517]|uniref:Uncharacterized protein n=1 Tax=Kazachstania africana (strain ATCC 22294 / BCRC 22015 / CBS 2517 / CECT 1963 / NBRC 1671 / NRRL Y-8276) TaxID=1071382 RepID=H2ARP2_KAZAF|nr:hypothetical protein KAFR_0C00470 [Kazachstania africana CBS 2517]CCF57042.1 hypothetical protein KAFR_0C00470 [Kazachstania africana CBS 2517]